MSVAKSTLREPEGERLIRSLKTYELPTELANDLEEEAILKAMQRDKKFEAGQIRFVLLDKLGNGFVSKDVTTADIKSAIRDLRGSSA